MNKQIEITLTLIHLVKNPNTKTTWNEMDKTVEIVTEREHNLATKDETIKWFRRLGGKENVTRAYTALGYVPIKIVSTSPNGFDRTIREYKIKLV
jgi:hypothetical protein